MGRVRSEAAGAGAPLGPPAVVGVAARRRAGLVLAAMPKEIGGFLDPGFGDGAVAAGVLQRHPEAFVTVAAESADAVAAWEVTRDDPEGLIRVVAFHAERHGPAYVAAEIALDEERLAGLSTLERAARHIYLRGVEVGEAGATAGGGAVRRDADARGAAGRDAADARGAAGRSGADVRGAAGRDGAGAVAFDAGNVRRLAGVLRERDVAFVVGAPFEVLREVREDDLVLLDPEFGGVQGMRVEREMRRFAAAAAARGALVIAPSPRGAEAGLYAGWPGFSRVGAHPEPDAVWGNGLLARRLRAEARA